MQLDVDYVRRQFPSLETEWAFMDNAGGAQILGSVVERINEYFLTSNVQLGASYELSQLARARLNEASESIAQYINAPDSSEIVMGPSTTMLTRALASSFLKSLQPGDEIIVTQFDHEANIGPWLELENHGVIIRFWELNTDSLEIDLHQLRSLLNHKTRLVALTHVSNILGVIHPIKEIAQIVREAGALSFIDGVAFAPHRRIDVQEWDVDFYVFSFYKVFGPHHAVLYGKRDLLLSLPGINHFFVAEDYVPYKFQPGSPNYELSYGTIGIMDYVSSLAGHHQIITDESITKVGLDSVFDLIASHEEKLSARLLDFLATKSSVSVYGSASSDQGIRVPTIAFSVEGSSSESITMQTDKHQVAIRYGHFYSRRLVDKVGLPIDDGVVRVSMVHYNTLDEVDRLINILDPLL